MGQLNRNEYTQLLNFIREGSYKKFCQVVKENHQIPIEGSHSLKFLISCCQSYKDTYSNEYLVKFINCLDLTEDTRCIDIKNYILSVFNIFKSLIKKNDWTGIKSIWHLIYPFRHDLEGDKLKYYYSIRQILLQGLMMENANTSDELLRLILKFFIEFEKVYPKDGILIMLYKFTMTFKKQKFSTKLIAWSIDAVIENECNIYTKANFKCLVAMLKLFLTDPTSLDAIDALITAIEEICTHIKTQEKEEVNKGFLEVINYLESTMELYKPLDQIDLSSSKVFLGPIEQMNRAHSNSTWLVFLSELVRLCTMTQSQIAKIERSRTKQPCRNKVKYTPALDNSLHAYVSHAKSQAIVLKRTVMSSKCCCSITTLYVSAIMAQTDAFDYIARILQLLENPADVSANLYAALCKLLASTIEMLQVVADADCSHFTSAWGTVCSHVYSCTRELVQDKRQNVAILFIEPMVRARFRFCEKSREIDEKYAAPMLYFLADFLVALKRYDDALDACALGARLSHKKADQFLRIWNSVTYNSKNEETVCDRLEKKSPYMRKMCGDILDLTKSEKADVCMREVRNYVAHYKKWSLVERALNQLANLLDIQEFLSFLSTLPFEVLQICFFNFPLTQDIVSEANLDAFHCAVYKYCAYNTNFRKQREDFKGLPKVQAIEDRPAGDTPDAKNYSHISLKVYDEITAPLREAFDALGRCEKSNDSHECAIDMAIQMGHEFEFHCDEVNARKALQFAYENATNSSKQKISAATSLLKYLPMRTVKAVDGAVVKLLGSYDKDVYAKFKFYAQLTVIYLRNNLLEDFRRCYHKTVHLFYKFGGTRYADSNVERDFDKDLATGYYALMIGALDMLACKDVVDELHGHQLFPLDNIWRQLRAYVYSPKVGLEKRTELYNVFFDLGEHMVWKYYWRTMHREAQKYAQAMASLAENALCTLRAHRQLLYLGKIALLKNEADKAQSFVSDLEVILQIDYADQEDELCANFDNVVLIRCASPVAIKAHREPAFLQHERDCSCICCTTKECQVALMEAYLLKTKVSSLYGDPKTTDKLLKGCFKLYRKLREKFMFFSGDLHVELLRTRMRVGPGNDPEILKRDKDEICALFEQRKFWNVYLFNDVNILYVTSCLKMLTASKNTRSSTPESRGMNLDEQHSPVIHTPVSAKSSNLHEASNRQSERRHFLEAPEGCGGARPKLRGKNLYAELDEAKNSEKTPATNEETKEGAKTVAKRSTRANTRKHLR